MMGLVIFFGIWTGFIVGIETWEITSNIGASISFGVVIACSLLAILVYLERVLSSLKEILSSQRKEIPFSFKFKGGKEE